MNESCSKSELCSSRICILVNRVGVFVFNALASLFWVYISRANFCLLRFLAPRVCYEYCGAIVELIGVVDSLGVLYCAAWGWSSHTRVLPGFYYRNTTVAAALEMQTNDENNGHFFFFPIKPLKSASRTLLPNGNAVLVNATIPEHTYDSLKTSRSQLIFRRHITHGPPKHHCCEGVSGSLRLVQFQVDGGYL